MKVIIDIEYVTRTTACKFSKTCLEEFDSSLCCDIIKEGSNYLFVAPVSTFKSSNCTYIRVITSDEGEVQICSCPVRLEIYRKYGI